MTLFCLNVHKIPGENETGSVYWFQQSQNHCNFAERKTLSDFHYRVELFPLTSQHSNYECLIRAIQHFQLLFSLVYSREKRLRKHHLKVVSRKEMIGSTSSFAFKTLIKWK